MPEQPRTIPLKPLAISGLCITKAALIDALRVYVPGLADLDQIEDGQRFLLTLNQGQTGPTEVQG